MGGAQVEAQVMKMITQREDGERREGFGREMISTYLFLNQLVSTCSGGTERGAQPLTDDYVSCIVWKGEDLDLR